MLSRDVEVHTPTHICAQTDSYTPHTDRQTDRHTHLQTTRLVAPTFQGSNPLTQPRDAN